MHSAPRTSLVTLSTTGGHSLDGAYYAAPDGHPADVAVLYIHGKGGNFYTGPSRFLPEALQLSGVAHLALNMRFHDLAYTRYDCEGGDTEEHPVQGGMWESISEGVNDIDAGVRWLQSIGCTRIVLVGHSAGGYYVGAYQPASSAIAGRVLLSPLQDHRFALQLWFPGEGELEAKLSEAAALVAAGKGHHLIPIPVWYYAISARTLLERAAQPDDVWKDSLAIDTAPVLMTWGDLESRHHLWSELFDGLPRENKTKCVLEGCDHFYLGFQDQLATAIGQFITGDS